MNRLILAAVAAIVALAVILFAVAVTSGDDEDVDNGATNPTATPAATETPPPATQTPDAPVSATPLPTQPPGQPTAVPPTAVPPATLAPGRHAEPAPIDDVQVLTLESFPPQYVVKVRAGLPGGCAERYTHEVTRNGNLVQVVVLNSLPDGNVACTMIYGMYELNINLGSDFTSGETYTVRVNDREVTFTAQ